MTYIDNEGYYSQDTAPTKKNKECDVYVKTKDLSKDQIVVASQEELASHVLCHAQVIIINLLRRKHLRSFEFVASKCECLKTTCLNIW